MDDSAWIADEALMGKDVELCVLSFVWRFLRKFGRSSYSTSLHVDGSPTISADV